MSANSNELKGWQLSTWTIRQKLIFDINLAKYAKTKYLLQILNPLSFVFRDVPHQCEMLSRRPRCLTWNTKNVRYLPGRYEHACTHSHTKARRSCKQRSFKWMPVSCTHLNFSGCCCVSSASVWASVSSPCSTSGGIISWHTYPPLNDLSSSSASHLIKTERRELNAIQRSQCFQLHLLSLWKWMAAAENSDVLSRHDEGSLNGSYDLCLCCLWLKALAGDSTNHVTHLAHYIRYLYQHCAFFSRPLYVSPAYVLLIEIISAYWKEKRQKGHIKFHLTWSRWSLCAVTEHWLWGV